MKQLCTIVLFFCVFLTSADDDELPLLWGSLDWSSDGRYIAVTTDKGVHIHNSEDLSLYKVLTDYPSTSIKWSNDGLRLAFQSEDGLGVTVWDLKSDEEVRSTLPGLEKSVHITSIQWSPESEALAMAFEDEVQIHDLERSTVNSRQSFEALYHIGYPQIHWRPDSMEILSSPFLNGIAVWHRYTGMLVDFISNMDGDNSPARWSPDGNMIAAGNGPVFVWRVKLVNPYDVRVESVRERIHKLVYEPGRFHGLSWNPDSTKLALVFSHAESGYPPKRDFSRDGVLIWDISRGGTALIQGIFIYDTWYPTHKVIEWSPDGSRLAAISSDGRIVIWKDHTYEVLAEYDGYQSVLEW